jgi:hypothetical protein
MTSDKMSRHGWELSPFSVYLINALLRDLLNNQLFVHLSLRQQIDPGINLKHEVELWMDEMGIPEEVKGSDSFLKSYRSWRKKKKPSLVRKHGRPRNISTGIQGVLFDNTRF